MEVLVSQETSARWTLFVCLFVCEFVTHIAIKEQNSGILYTFEAKSVFFKLKWNTINRDGSFELINLPAHINNTPVVTTLKSYDCSDGVHRAPISAMRTRLSHLK